MATATKKTEFQEMLQELVNRGALNIEGKSALQFPVNYTDEFKGTVIEDLTEDNRSVNALRRNGIMTFGDLIEKWETLGKMRNVGERSVRLIRNALMGKYYESLSVDGKASFLKKIIDMNNAASKAKEA